MTVIKLVMISAYRSFTLFYRVFKKIIDVFVIFAINIIDV